MSLFTTKKNVETLTLPEGYTAKFTFISLDRPSTLPNTKMAEYNWNLFYENTLVSAGRDTVYMNDKDVLERVFANIYSYAVSHKKSTGLIKGFPYKVETVYDLPESVTIEKNSHSWYIAHQSDR